MIRLTAVALAAFTMAGIVATPEVKAASRAAYCDSYARHEADKKARPADALAGTIGGAIGGALIGAAINGGKGAGTGAIIGGVSGTALGAGATGNKWHKVYNKNFDKCMSGYSAAPVYYAAPPPGSKAWYQYCSAKYRSFDPNTGLYNTGSALKPCR